MLADRKTLLLRWRTPPAGKGLLGEAAVAASKTNTFLGERYRRIVKRRGKLKALVAVARSILIIVWHLLADPTKRFHELGADYHTTRINQGRKIRNLVRQLEALGQTVTLQPTAARQPEIPHPNPRSGRYQPAQAPSWSGAFSVREAGPLSVGGLVGLDDRAVDAKPEAAAAGVQRLHRGVTSSIVGHNGIPADEAAVVATPSASRRAIAAECGIGSPSVPSSPCTA